MLTTPDLYATEDLSALGGVLAVYAIVLLFSFLIGIVSYIFQSVGLFKMAKSLNLNHCWMSWVPVLNTYTLGKIGSKYIKKDGRPSAKFGGWLIGLEVAMFATVIGLIVAVVLIIIGGISMEEIGGSAPNGTFLGGFATFLLSYFALIGVGIAYSVVYYIALWRVFSIFDNSTATAFLIVSILFSVATPFFIFAIRNHKPALTYAERMGFVPAAAPKEPEVVAIPVMEETPITTENTDE